ncbi:MAG: hypothetical protein U9O20_00660 [Patescibacteria group bacterium]|nr:hypothetical protein [Patescibacteria group bacterium]
MVCQLTSIILVLIKLWKRIHSRRMKILLRRQLYLGRGGNYFIEQLLHGSNTKIRLDHKKLLILILNE